MILMSFTLNEGVKHNPCAWCARPRKSKTRERPGISKYTNHAMIVRMSKISTAGRSILSRMLIAQPLFFKRIEFLRSIVSQSQIGELDKVGFKTQDKPKVLSNEDFAANLRDRMSVPQLENDEVFSQFFLCRHQLVVGRHSEIS